MLNINILIIILFTIQRNKCKTGMFIRIEKELLLRMSPRQIHYMDFSQVVKTIWIRKEVKVRYTNLVHYFLSSIFPFSIA